MHFQNIFLAALAGIVSVQATTIVDVLNTPELSTLKSLVTQFPDLVDTLSKATEITVVAPSNDAFSKFLGANPGADKNQDLVKNLLTYHVISGVYEASAITNSPGPVFVPTMLTSTEYSLVTGGQRVGAQAKNGGVFFLSGLLKECMVTTADVKFDGGVAHIVDDVLTIPAKTSDTATAAGLTQLVGAVTTVGLADTADTTPDLTVFAPNDDAFAAIMSTVSGASRQDLINILTYHVVAGTVAYSSSLKDGQEIHTLNGASVKVKISGSTVMINDAKVLIANVLTKNGVAHVINKVLSPAGMPNANTGPASNLGGMGGGSMGNMPGMNNQTNATIPGTNFTSGVPTPTTTPVVSTGAAVPNWGGMAVDKAMAAGFAALAIGAAI